MEHQWNKLRFFDEGKHNDSFDPWKQIGELRGVVFLALKWKYETEEGEGVDKLDHKPNIADIF